MGPVWNIEAFLMRDNFDLSRGSRRGPTKKADYPSKHHTGVHHRIMRPKFLTPKKYLEDLRERLAKRSILAKAVKMQRGCADHTVTELAVTNFSC